jgi:hypothetical protein
MALLYPWATKEYLLWNMTIGQIYMYIGKATQIKGGEKESTAIDSDDITELKKIREQMKQEELKKQYGNIEDE